MDKYKKMNPFDEEGEGEGEGQAEGERGDEGGEEEAIAAHARAEQRRPERARKSEEEGGGSLEEQLWALCDDNRIEDLKQFLLDHTELDVNWQHAGYAGWTPLHNVASQGNADITAILLRHPHIDHNVLDAEGKTPFYHAAQLAQIFVVIEMLKIPTVDINRPDPDGATPIWWAAFKGHLDVVKWMALSGREVDLTSKPHRSPVAGAPLARLAPYEVARKAGHRQINLLLEFLKTNPKGVRTKLRENLNALDFEVSTDPKLNWIGFEAYLKGREIPGDGYEHVAAPQKPGLLSLTNLTNLTSIFKIK